VLLAAIIETPWANNLPKTRARAAVRATKRDEIGPVSSGGVRPFSRTTALPASVDAGLLAHGMRTVTSSELT